MIADRLVAFCIVATVGLKLAPWLFVLLYLQGLVERRALARHRWEHPLGTVALGRRVRGVERGLAYSGTVTWAGRTPAGGRAMCDVQLDGTGEEITVAFDEHGRSHGGWVAELRVTTGVCAT